MRVPILTAALCVIPALALSQSLGDAARRQAKKRSTETPAAKSYSDADLPANPDPPEASEDAPPPEADVEGEATPARTPPTADEIVRRQLDKEERERKRNEQRWRERSRWALGRIASAERAYDAACNGRSLPGG